MPYPLRPKCLDVSNRLKLSVPGQECGAQLSGALEVVPMQVDRRGRDRGMAQVVAYGDELGTTAERMGCVGEAVGLPSMCHFFTFNWY